MESLSDKLRSLGVQLGAEGIQPPPQSNKHQSIDEILPGKWEHTPHGDTFVVHKYTPIGTTIGEVRLAPADNVSWLDHAALLPGIASIPHTEIAFIDTETTSLSGGTGTYSFLIGIGKFESDHFHLAQFFMQDPVQETAHLSAIESFLAPIKVIVSYNGKAFDLPRLKTRFQLYGWPPPLQDAPHLDLLHIVRRIWSAFLPSCSLGDVEHYLLKIERSSDDVPGWQIADTFFEFLRTKDPTPLHRIFYHNEMDVLSLALLLRYTTLRITQPLSPSYSYKKDLAGIGSFLSSIQYLEQSIRVLKHSLSQLSLSEADHLSVEKKLARIYKFNNQYDQAIPLWNSAARAGDLEAHLELAMVYEHKKKNIQEAIHWTLSAIDLLHNPTNDRFLEVSALDDFHHRLQRLKNKSQGNLNRGKDS